MKRETIERHLKEVEGQLRSIGFSPLRASLEREYERLNEDLAEYDAGATTKNVEAESSAERLENLNAGIGGTYLSANEPPGYTDSDGDRWDFFQHSSGLWVTVCASMGGEALAINEKERGEPADKLRAWLKETGRA